MYKANKIYTHKNCVDGTGSALFLKHLYPNAQVRFFNYDKKLEDLVPEENVIFADLTPRTKIDQWIDCGTKIIDHHSSEEKNIKKFADYIYQTGLGISGTTLCNDYVNMNLSTSNRFAELVGITDTYFDKNPLWNDAKVQHAIIGKFPQEWWLKLGLIDTINYINKSSELGNLILVEQDKEIIKHYQNCIRHTFDRRKFAIIDKMLSTSDFCGKYGDEFDAIFGFSVFIEGANKIVAFSCRSKDSNKFDCSKFAKENGGGGHKNAAGFRVNVAPNQAADPIDVLIKLLDAYLVYN